MKNEKNENISTDASRREPPYTTTAATSTDATASQISTAAATKKPRYRGKSGDTLCWTCHNCAGGSVCPWINNGTAVPNWTAAPTIIHETIGEDKKRKVVTETRSYQVFECPLYKQDYDYFVSRSDIYKIMSKRGHYGITWYRDHAELSNKIWIKYTHMRDKYREKYGRDFTEEELAKIFIVAETRAIKKALDGGLSLWKTNILEEDFKKYCKNS